MRALHRVVGEVGIWEELESEAVDLVELAESLGVDDDELLDEVESHLNTLKSKLDDRQFELMLGGDLDDSDAIVTIHSGAGGTESQDWAEMLLRIDRKSVV